MSGIALPRVRGAYENRLETKNVSEKFHRICGMIAKRWKRLESGGGSGHKRSVYCKLAPKRTASAK